MSQLQKLRAKTNKVKIAFTFEKTVNGIEINVKSQKLGGLISEFLDNYESFNDIMALPIYRSLTNYTDHDRSNTIIHSNIINLDFLSNITTRSSVTLKINNVFTNEEIKAFIELFETYMLKIKMLVIGLNKVNNEVTV